MVGKLRSLLALAAGLALFFEASARLALGAGWVRERVLGNDDASHRLAWVERRSTGERAPYPFDVHHPTRGWALKPGLRDLPAFGDERLSSNSRGLRGVAEHDYGRSPGRRRVLALGDSFTFGEDVADDEAFPAVLETLLPGTEVLNLGVHGYGHDQMLLYLQEEGVRYRPDVVVLGFVAVDAERNLFAFRDHAKPRFELRDGKLVLTGTPVPTPEETLAAEPWRSKFVDLLTMLSARLQERTGRRDREIVSLTLALLDEIVRTARAAGAEPVLAYLPVYNEVHRVPPGSSAAQRFFLGYCRDRRLRCVFLPEPFAEARQRGAVFREGHWGPFEHRLAAECLRDELRRPPDASGP